MRLDLFSKGDSVLLLGEGNFSFSVSLHKHKLPIEIVATCFESKAEFSHQQENIKYLESNKVPVFFNVDATKLRECDHLSDRRFSKIVFNFPHVGGKMKIHLNRALLRDVFENCSQMLAEDGLMIVSLCRGQGGTPADQPPRKWHDSWQVTEMAAHSDFLLVAVEPFLPHCFPDYRCHGYRGHDVPFRLAGALVHVFAKAEPPFPSLSPALPATRLALFPLKPRSQVLVPVIYSQLYRSNPIANPHSAVSFVKQLVVGNGSDCELLSDDDLPFHVGGGGGGGVACRVGGRECKLRGDPLDVLTYLVEVAGKEGGGSKKTVFLGTYFRPLGRDWSRGPMEVKLTIAGEGLSDVMERLVEGLTGSFKEEDVVLWRRERGEGGLGGAGYSVTSCEDVVVESRRRCGGVRAGVLYRVQCKGMSSEVCVVNVEALCEYFFNVGWRALWAEGARVVVDECGRPCLRLRSLYPREYALEMTLKYREEYSEERVDELLWLAAGQVIEEVKVIGEYKSAEGWSSRSYRLIYRSLDKALFRKRVVEVHSKIVVEVLKLGLNVAID